MANSALYLAQLITKNHLEVLALNITIFSDPLAFVEHGFLHIFTRGLVFSLLFALLPPFDEMLILMLEEIITKNKMHSAFIALSTEKRFKSFSYLQDLMDGIFMLLMF